MKTSSLELGLVLLLSLLGCDTKERCVADCDANDSGDMAPVSAECEDDRNLASEFILRNNTCETLLDCVPVDGFCHPDAVCGTVSVSAAADLDAWNELNLAMGDSCGPCSADLCGPAVMCNEARQCEASFGSQDFCPNVERDIETFLAAHRSCETVADCKFIVSSCHVDNCESVAVNVDTDPDEWARLDTTLAQCSGDEPGLFCNFVGDCGPTLSCSDAGECTSTF